MLLTVCTSQMRVSGGRPADRRSRVAHILHISGGYKFRETKLRDIFVQRSSDFGAVESRVWLNVTSVGESEPSNKWGNDSCGAG